MVSSEKVETSKKRRHLSKKNKISWRKNVDIQDVEDFLEDQRLEERLGTPFAQKDDSELFVIDTLPSLKSLKASSKGARGLTARQSKRLALQEPPKCFQPLINTSKVGDPSGKRNHVRPVLPGKQTELKRQRSGAYRKKWEAAQKNRAQHRQQKKELQECRTNITQDLWGAKEVTPTAPVPEPEWLSRDTRDCNKLKIRPPRPPRHAAKAKPIVAPHPGASYNPNFKDHQDLLQDVITQELKVMKEEEHLNRVTSAMFRRVSPREKAEEDLKELRQGLDQDGPDSEGDGQDYRAANPPAQRRKKDLRKKRHMREEKLAQVTRLVEAKEKKKHSDVYKLRFLQKAVVSREAQQKTERAQRIKKRIEAPPQPRINSVGYREPPPTFLEAQELSGNLRNLTPKGGGLLDHWTSLQRRGLAPVSSPHVLKAAKKKRYTLTSHKLPEEIKEGPAKPSKRK